MRDMLSLGKTAADISQSLVGHFGDPIVNYTNHSSLKFRIWALVSSHYGGGKNTGSCPNCL